MPWGGQFVRDQVQTTRPRTPPRHVHLPGRPSPIGAVFDQIENFIDDEIEDDRSVTLGVLMEFIVDELNVPVSRHAVWEYMENHGYAYVSGIPTEAERVNVSRAEVQRFYTTTLPNAVEGAHPALVFNMDEMGAERYADRKHVKVFVPRGVAHSEGMPIGVPRSSRRCTLIGCIALDGSRLKPAVVIKNLTVNSLLFENGYSPENVTIYTTANSFVTGDVFGDWLKDVFIPYVEERREALRGRLETFDERAVLVLDGCSSRKKRGAPSAPGGKKHHDVVFGPPLITPHPAPRPWQFWAGEGPHPRRGDLRRQHRGVR